MYDTPILVKAFQKPKYAWKKLNRKFLHFFQDTKQILFSQNRSSEIINEKEIRFIGLRRSGNHAVIQWLKEQQPGVFCHLNDVPINENPFRHTYEYFLDHYALPNRHLKKKERLRQESMGNFTQKNCLLYNYEDYDFKQIISKNFERKHDLYLGKSGKKYDLLILRDPFNLLASRMKKGFLAVKSSRKTFVDLWISHAREFLGETNYLQNEKICLNYNFWVNNIDYRRQIAEQLDLEFTDAGLNKVSARAGGSSFDQTTYKNEASKMKVHSRWQYYQDNDLYRQILNNQELLSYSQRIFGHIPRTEILIDSFNK